MVSLLCPGSGDVRREGDGFVAGSGDDVGVSTHDAAKNETLSHGCGGEEIEKLLGFGVADLRVAEELNEDDSDEP